MNEKYIEIKPLHIILEATDAHEMDGLITKYLIDGYRLYGSLQIVRNSIDPHDVVYTHSFVQSMLFSNFEFEIMRVKPTLSTDDKMTYHKIQQ